MVLTVIAGAAASAIIGKLVDSCFSYIQAYPALQDVRVELKRLQLALPQVEAVLTAVEEEASISEQNKGLVTWLWQLRDAVENAEDVLDELEYYKLKETIKDRDDEVHGILSKCKKKIDRFVNPKFSNDTLKRLREAVMELDMVAAGTERLLQLVTGFYGPSVKRRKLENIMKARETSSTVIKSEVLGRDKERDQIVEWLIKPAGDVDVDVSAFTIVGMGGLGKTTLAQLVYSDERVREHFDPIMWVCVSQDFYAAAIIRKMLNNSCSTILDALHKDLIQKLTSKRFLLILDDVWNDANTTEWEKLVAPLKFGQRGSKILLTTRMGSVADMAAKVMKCKRESLNLNELEESDSMSLFKKHALFGVNLDDYRNLQPIGEHIVKKLGGSPLAIKIMGGMLNSCMEYEYWKKILEEDKMKLHEGNDNIMAVLRLSYDHLPTNLQLCFRYCSLFPQDHMFKRKKLVNMWIGSGLIPQSICGEQRHPDDIGNEYLNLLTRKSFFTCKTSDNDIIVRKKITTKEYFMHDLLHDLAQSVSQGECIRIVGDVAENSIPKPLRHLSVEMVNPLSIREISNLKNLRSLVISHEGYGRDYADHALEFIEVIKRFKKLRLLIIDVNFDLSKLPDALSSLIHLRYLSLSRVTINVFASIDGLTNLVNLRSLDVPYHMRENIPYISKLPFIHKLDNFIVREESGYKISELKNLKDLRHLRIKDLENVRSSEEAIEANLNKKKYLKSLSLEWLEDRSNRAEADEQLLDNLCPHINLKEMYIYQYQGAKSPCWLTNLHLVNLTSIELIHCKGWERLPPLGQFSSLQYLQLRGLHAIKQIDCSFFGSSSGCVFPSLKKLFFEDMPNLVEWVGVHDGCMFPQLLYMWITNCPNLREIPTLPYGLRSLHISNVGLTALSTKNQNYADNNQQEHFQALESLVIQLCEKLEYFPTDFFGKFNATSFLSVENCPKLTKCGISDIQLPSKLSDLTIRSCGDLEVPLLWSADLTSLRRLELNDCARIASLPLAQVCARWTMLSYLTIENCKELSSFGGIQALVSLRRLDIEGCDKLIEVALLQQPPFPSNVGQKKNAVLDSFLKNGELFIDHHALLLMEPLRSLSSIKWLTLFDASQLTSLPEEWLLQNHAALEHLEIKNASFLQSLPQSMTKVCSLERLILWDANLIQSLPDLPASLRYLRIFECHPVLKERCQENIGADWPKIAHIPDVTIEQSYDDEYIFTEERERAASSSSSPSLAAAATSSSSSSGRLWRGRAQASPTTHRGWFPRVFDAVTPQGS